MKEHRNISIADQIFDQLERDILSGKYRRGEVLSELRLAKELDVSRTPIREALLRLEQENVLKETGRGMEVIGISTEDMLDLYDVRLHLEGEAAKRAALNITDEQLAELLELAEQFVKLKPETPQMFYLWGHSYEFDEFDHWQLIEDFFKIISGKEDIFYGTNCEVLLDMKQV